MPDPDDHSLLQEYCTSRSEAAFTRLVQRHLPLVYHAALRRLSIPALAEEAAQNAFARLAVKISAVARHPERLRAWLHRTAFLEACTIARKENRLTRLPAPPEPDAMNRPELYDRLDEALNRLPELDRELLLRRCCEGEDFRHIAAATGKSEAACQKRVERALLRLEQMLGGAGAAGVVVAVLSGSATSTRAAAIPSAETVAAAALQKSASVGGGTVTGAFSGLAAAACIAAGLGGSALGWQRETVVPSSPAAGAGAKGTSQNAPQAADVPALPGTGQTGSLEDVLESIQALRLKPLVDFLPVATVADLRAIIAEDDLAGLGEAAPDRSTAHLIALDHWAHLAPAQAFQYGISRDRENTGSGMPVSAKALSIWRKNDASAAFAAFAALPQTDRAQIAVSMTAADGPLCDELVQRHPDIFQEVAMHRAWNPDAAALDAEAEKLGEEILSGQDSQWRYKNETMRALRNLSWKAPKATLARAEAITEPDLRAQVLTYLHDLEFAYMPVQMLQEIMYALPPGLERSRAAAFLPEKHWRDALTELQGSEPGAERDVLYHQLARKLATTDPWQLLELTVSLKGVLSSPEPALSGFAHLPNGETRQRISSIPWENHLYTALTVAGREDPQRALALLPEIAARLGSRGSPHWQSGPLQDMAAKTVEGWLEKEPAAAIRWVAETGCGPLIAAVTNGLDSASGDPEPLIPLLADASEDLRGMARRALTHSVSAGVENGTAGALLARMPPAEADQIVDSLAMTAAGNEDYLFAERIAAFASPGQRTGAILPRLAASWLQQEPAEALTWLRSLPAPDRRTVVSHLLSSATLQEESRQSLQNLAP